MGENKTFGFYLYQKQGPHELVLKDMLQLLKVTCIQKSSSFAYIESQTSLIPHLSLWENIQIQTSGQNWKEFLKTLGPEVSGLAKILREPNKLAQEAEAWEKFTVSLIKGLINPAPSLLVDMNEELLSPLMIQHFKKILLNESSNKKIYLASANTSLWLDSAHSFVTRKGYEFSIEHLDVERVKKHWVA